MSGLESTLSVRNVYKRTAPRYDQPANGRRSTARLEQRGRPES